MVFKKEHREQRQNRRKMLQEQEAAFRLKKDKSSLSVDNPAKSTVGFTEPAEESVKEQWVRSHRACFCLDCEESFETFLRKAS